MNNEQILIELQQSFDNDYGVSQQLLDSVEILFAKIRKIRHILNSEHLVYDDENEEFMYMPFVVKRELEEIRKLLESEE